jgi:NAD(P)-dependent dehydrogenase (short-subunit alcohol dehydrogenase family)
MPTAVVVGASSGLGWELANALVAQGRAVVGLARTGPHGPLAPGFELERVDIGDAEQIAAFGDRCARRELRVDLLFLCAAIIHRRPGLAAQSSEDLIEQYRVNAVGPLLVVRELQARGLLAVDGKVVGISSQLAYLRNKHIYPEYGYSASKAALLHFLEAMRHDPSLHGLQVYAVDPGRMRTRLASKDAPLDPADAADAILTMMAAPPVVGGMQHVDGTLNPWG